MKVRAKIVQFDKRTWWGIAVYDLTPVEFHGTTVQGMTRDFLNLVGKDVDLLFNDEGNLFDVRVVQTK